MNTYSKTVYVEVEAANEEDALEQVIAALGPVVMDANNNISYVDFQGPIEEVQV